MYFLLFMLFGFIIRLFRRIFSLNSCTTQLPTMVQQILQTNAVAYHKTCFSVASSDRNSDPEIFLAPNNNYSQIVLFVFHLSTFFPH